MAVKVGALGFFYCDRCSAFRFPESAGEEPGLPTGRSRPQNQDAWDEGELRSPYDAMYKKDIRKVRTSCRRAGDKDGAALCDLALAGDPDAISGVVDIAAMPRRRRCDEGHG